MKTREEKQEEAAARRTERASRTPAQQLQRLDELVGPGGAVRERARLTAQLTKPGTPTKEPKKGGFTRPTAPADPQPAVFAGETGPFFLERSEMPYVDLGDSSGAVRIESVEWLRKLGKARGLDLRSVLEDYRRFNKVREAVGA